MSDGKGGENVSARAVPEAIIGAEAGAFGRMSVCKGREKVSSSGSCPPSAEASRARVEGAKRMGKIESRRGRRPSSADLTAPDGGAKSIQRRNKSIQRRIESSVRKQDRKRENERAEKMRWIDELVSNAQMAPMAVGEDEKLKDPLIHPFFRLDLDRLGLDKDHHRESMKLEAEVKLKREDEDQHGESPKLAQMKTEGKERVFVVLDGEVWESEQPKPKSPAPRAETMEDGKVEVWRMMEPEEPELEEMEPDDERHWMTVSRYRIHWEERWSSDYGSFEDITRIPPMRFTDKGKADLDILYDEDDTLQVYSVKLAATRGSLRLPLDVFGMVAVRDPIDHNRNIIFQRKRDECQTLTEKDPYLVLAGPTRAVMFSSAKSDPVIIEVDLKVKGATESEDAYLSFFVSPLTCSGVYSCVFSHAYTSKLSRLEFLLAHTVYSVEATIFVRVTDGSWPSGLRGLFTVSTVFRHVIMQCSPGVGQMRIILLDSGCQEVPVAGDGSIKLSRNVISTEIVGAVIFQVKALEGDIEVVEKDISFRPLEANKTISELDIGFCKMEVTVVWTRVFCPY